MFASVTQFPPLGMSYEDPLCLYRLPESSVSPWRILGSTSFQLQIEQNNVGAPFESLSLRSLRPDLNKQAFFFFPFLPGIAREQTGCFITF